MFRLLRLALLVWPLLARGERLSVWHYGVADGLTDHNARLLCSSRDGYVWVSSGTDLARFDGHGFRIFSAADGWTGGRPYSMLETVSGELLIGGALGLYRLDPHATSPERRFTRITLPGPAREMEFLFEDSQRRVWVSSLDGGYLRDDRGAWRGLAEFRPVRRHNQRTVGQVAEDDSGVWAATYSGIYCLRRDGVLERYSSADHGLFNEAAISLAIGPDGKIYAGTEQGIFRLTRRAPLSRAVIDRVWTVRDGLPGMFVPAMVFWRDALWAATPGGVVRIDLQGRIESYRDLAGIREPAVEHLGVDRSGTLWIGSDGAGLFLAPNRGFTNFGAADGVMFAHPEQILEDDDGRLLAVSKTERNLSLNFFNGRDGFAARPVHLPQQAMLPWGWSQIAVRPRSGVFWIAANEGVLIVREGAAPEIWRGPLEGIRGYVFRLFQESQGAVWASLSGLSHHHVSRWDPVAGSWRSYAQEAVARSAPGGFSNSVASFAEDRAGNIWMGCLSKGLWRYRAGRFEDMQAGEWGGVRALHVDDRGRLWIGTQTGGLLWVDDPVGLRPRFERYTRGDGLSTGAISCLTSGSDGSIYVCTGRGVDRLDPETGHVRHYTIADGLITGGLRAGYRDSRGAIWFATPEGLSRFIPPGAATAAASTVRIQALRVADRAVPVAATGLVHAKGIVLAADDRRLEVEYVAFDPAARYQHRLAGVNDWSAPSTARHLRFEGLSPGRYRFEVRAVGENGGRSAQVATVDFRVTPPVWQRWWFLGACGATLMGLAYGLHRYRLQQAIAVERIRLRIAADLHDDIGASLSHVSILGELARRSLDSGSAGTAELIERMAEMSRDAATAMSDIVWSIQPNQDSVGDLVQRMRRFASDLLESRDIEFNFLAPQADSLERLRLETRRDVMLIFKEAIHNAARHSCCTHVRAELTLHEGRLHLTVEDNGRGGATASRDGRGLRTMEARAQRLGGRFQIKGRTPCGTVVLVELPAFNHR